MGTKDAELTILKEKHNVEEDIMKWYGQMEIERRKMKQEIFLVKGERDKLFEEN